MPASWKEIAEAISAGAGVRRGSEAALEVAAAWIQETRGLGLQLTELLHQPVPVKLNRAERDDPTVFINRVLDGLCNEQGLEIEYLIPDGVSSLKVYADLRGKTLTSSMTIGAPEDRQGPRELAAATAHQDARGRHSHQGHLRTTRGHAGTSCESTRGPGRTQQGRPGNLSVALRGEADDGPGTKDGRPQDDCAGVGGSRAGVLHRGRTVPAGVGAQRAKGADAEGEGEEGRWSV